MPSESRLRTVVLTLEYSTRSSYYLDWAEAFAASPLFAVTRFNLFNREQRQAACRATADAELIVALHACSADTLDYIKPLQGALQQRCGRFLIFIGNEYNLPWSRLADKRAFLRDTAADFVATQLPREAGEWLYADTGARVLPLPHALNDAVFRRSTPDAARTIDIGGRSARYPVFVGDDERNRVHDCFAAIGPQAGLTIDIDTEDRLDRPGWASFLDNCRGTIGTEAGTWFLERDDRTALAIRAYIDAQTGPAIRADGAVHALSCRLPYGLKTGLRALTKILPIRHEAIDRGAVDFAEIEERFFAGRPRCPAYSKCISSRHFDAAGAGACQILVRGRYNDILTADEHYIPVDPDLGNAAEVVARFRDPAERQRIAEAAYTLAHERHTYRHRITALHDALTAGPATVVA